MKIVLTPDWFLGKDVLIDIFSFTVLLAFFILCLRSYSIKKNKNSLYLGWAFFSISLAQLAAVLTKLVLYYDTTFTQQIGQVIITNHVMQSVDTFYQLGFFFHKFLTLLGLFIIYKLPDKKKRSLDFLIAIYFLILSALAGNMVYYIFHISVIIFLVLITGYYIEVYKQNKSYNTRVLLVAFILLCLAHFIMLLSNIGTIFVIGNLVELASYIILLFLAIRILRAGKN